MDISTKPLESYAYLEKLYLSISEEKIIQQKIDNEINEEKIINYDSKIGQSIDILA